MPPKIKINIILDLTKMPIPLKREWAETIEKLKKQRNVKVIGENKNETKIV